jgi:hypothetical protein
MTGSNSINMSVSEKLAQRIKESELGALLGPEDVDKLAADAIKLGFFTDRVDNSGYQQKRLPPLIVEMAITAFREQVQKRATVVMDELMKDATFVAALAEAVQAALPALMMDAARYGMEQRMATAVQSNVETMATNVAQLIRSRGMV